MDKIEILKQMNKCTEKVKKLGFKPIMTIKHKDKAPKGYVVIVEPQSYEDIIYDTNKTSTIWDYDDVYIIIEDIRSVLPIWLTRNNEYIELVTINKKYKDIITKAQDKQEEYLIRGKILDMCIRNYLLTNNMQHEVYPDQYKNVFVISDTHFGHKNIMKYEDRYSKLGVETIEEHDKVLIDLWNTTVKQNDLIYILGDFSFRKGEATNELLKQLNGDKVLIKGNHDIYLDNKNFDKSLFKGIYDYKEIRYKGVEVILMHYPIYRFKHMERDKAVHLFGHIHNCYMPLPKKCYNVGAILNGFRPISLLEAIRRAQLNEGGIYNG